MNTARIRQALTDIEENTAALIWLEQYGSRIDGRDRDAASVSVHLYFAGSCPGSKEAQVVLSSFARLSLPEIIAQAIRNCRNTIEIAQEAIREESARATQHGEAA